MTSRRLALVALVPVLLLGGYLRVANLGAREYSSDELDHYFAARGLAASGEPVLPSGEPYTRGLDITRLTGLAIREIGDSERSARLPAAGLGVVSLFLFAAVAWMMAGPWPAVWATLLLSIYPEAVVQSRQVRFYGYQLDFSLLAMLACWMVVRVSATSISPRAPLRKYAWAAFAGVMFLCAARVQLTSLSVGAAALAVIALAAIVDVRALGMAAMRRSVSLHCLALALVIGAAVVLARPELVDRLLHLARFVPSWDGGTPGHPLTYYRALSEVFPVVVALAPVVFLVVARRDFRLAIFLFLWFGVPLALHSFVLAWKIERYVLGAIPALLLATGIAIDAGLLPLHRAVRYAVARRRPRGRLAPALASATVVGCVMFALLATPALHRSRRAASGAGDVPPTSWRLVAERIRMVPGSDTIPLGSSEALSSLHYWGRLDFTVRVGALERPRGDKFVQLMEGAPDWYAGVPVLTTPRAIFDRFGARPVLIGVDASRWNQGVDRTLVGELQRHGLELCQGECGTMRLFLWTPGGAQASMPLATRPPKPGSSS